MDDMGMQQKKDIMASMLREQREHSGAQESIERTKMEMEFIEHMQNLSAEERMEISDVDMFRLSGIKRKNLSHLLVTDQKRGGDSDEMLSVKENVFALERLLNMNLPLGEERLEAAIAEIKDNYKIAIASCKHYVTTKNPRFAAGVRRKALVTQTLDRLLEDEKLFEQGTKMFLSHETDEMPIQKTGDLLALAELHNYNNDAADTEDAEDEYLSSIENLTLEDYSVILDSKIKQGNVEIIDGRITITETSNSMFSMVFGNKQVESVYNKRFASKLVELVEKQQLDEGKKNQNVIENIKKDLGLLSGDTKMGPINLYSMKEAVRYAFYAASRVENLLKLGSSELAQSSEEVRADRATAEKIKSLFYETSESLTQTNYQGKILGESDAQITKRKNKIKDVMKAARLEGIILAEPSEAELDHLTNGSMNIILDQILEATNLLKSSIRNIAGGADIDLNNLLDSDKVKNGIAAYVMSINCAVNSDLRDLRKEALSDFIKELTFEEVGKVREETNVAKVHFENLEVRTLSMGGAGGLNGLVEKMLPTTKAWKSHEREVLSGTESLSLLCDSFEKIEQLKALGLREGLTAAQKASLISLGDAIDKVFANENNMDLVAKEIKGSRFAIGYEAVKKIKASGAEGDYKFKSACEAVAGIFVEKAEVAVEETKKKEKNLVEKQASMTAEQITMFDVLQGVISLDKLVESGSADVQSLEALRRVLHQFIPGKFMKKEVSFAGGKGTLLQKKDCSLYFIAGGQTLKLRENVSVICSTMENTMLMHLDIFGEEFAQEVISKLKFTGANDVIRSREKGITYLASKLGKPVTYFSNVTTPLVASYCKYLISGDISPEEVVSQVDMIESQVFLNNQETLELVANVEEQDQRERERIEAENVAADQRRAEQYKAAHPIKAAAGGVSGWFKRKMTQLKGAAVEFYEAHTSSQLQGVVKNAVEVKNRMQDDGKTTGEALKAVENEMMGKVKELMSDMMFSPNTWEMDRNADVPGLRLAKIYSKHIDTLIRLATKEDFISRAVDSLPLVSDEIKEVLTVKLQILLKESNLKKRLEKPDKELLQLLSASEKDIDHVVESAADSIQEEFVGAMDSLTQPTQTTRTTQTQRTEEIPANETAEQRAQRVQRELRASRQRLKDQLATATSGDSGQGLFVKNIFKNYFKSMPLSEKRSMYASAMRAVTVEDATQGEITPEVQVKFLGGYLKGAGPLLQKLFQGLPDAGFPEEFKAALKDMKSNLAPIPEKIVEAHFRDMVARSNGKVDRIEKVRSLGAASVGQAFLCRLHGPGMPEGGKEVVIKILRPDVRNKMMREKEVMLRCARMTDGNVDENGVDLKPGEIGGMESTYLGQLQRIEEELDLTIEARNASAGAIYDSGFETVHSVKVDNVIEPTTNTMILEKAEGDTVDRYISKATEEIQAIMDKYYTRSGNSYVGKELTDELRETKAADRERMAELLKGIEKRQKYLLQISKKWVIEGIYGTGFYHGDLHAGNIMVSDNGATIIDYGNATQLSTEQRDRVVRMMMAASLGIPKLFLDNFEKLLENTKPEVFAAKKAELLATITEIFSMGDQSDAGERIALALLKAQEIGIEVPPSINNFSTSQLRLQNTIEDINGTITDLRSKIQVMDTLGETVREDDYRIFERNLVDTSAAQGKFKRDLTADRFKMSSLPLSDFGSYMSTSEYWFGNRAWKFRDFEETQVKFIHNNPDIAQVMLEAIKNDPSSAFWVMLKGLRGCFLTKAEYEDFETFMTGLINEGTFMERYAEVEAKMQAIRAANKDIEIADRMKEYSALNTFVKMDQFLKVSIQAREGVIDEIIAGSNRNEFLQVIDNAKAYYDNPEQLENLKNELKRICTEIKQQKEAGLNGTELTLYIQQKCGELKGIIAQSYQLPQRLKDRRATLADEMEQRFDEAYNNSLFGSDEYVDFIDALSDTTKLSEITEQINLWRQDEKLEEEVRTNLGATFDAYKNAFETQAPDMKEKLKSFLKVYNKALLSQISNYEDRMDEERRNRTKIGNETPETFIDVMSSILSSNLKKTISMLGYSNIIRYHKVIGKAIG